MYLRRGSSDQLSRSRAMSCPSHPKKINDLPVELLSEIFERLFLPGSTIYIGFNDEVKHTRAANRQKICLMLVCRLWLSVADALPSLWTRLHLTFRPDITHPYPKLSVSRCGNKASHVYSHCRLEFKSGLSDDIELYAPFLQELRAHAREMKTIHFAAQLDKCSKIFAFLLYLGGHPGVAPPAMLETLFITIKGGLLYYPDELPSLQVVIRAPKLKTLRVSDMYCCPGRVTKMPNLTSLTLHYSILLGKAVWFLSWFLRGLPVLEELTISSAPHAWHDSQDDIDALRKLKYQDGKRVFPLSLPKLKKMQFRQLYGPLAGALYDLMDMPIVHEAVIEIAHSINLAVFLIKESQGRLVEQFLDCRCQLALNIHTPPAPPSLPRTRYLHTHDGHRRRVALSSYWSDKVALNPLHCTKSTRVQSCTCPILYAGHDEPPSHILCYQPLLRALRFTGLASRITQINISLASFSVLEADPDPESYDDEMHHGQDDDADAGWDRLLSLSPNLSVLTLTEVDASCKQGGLQALRNAFVQSGVLGKCACSPALAPRLKRLHVDLAMRPVAICRSAQTADTPASFSSSPPSTPSSCSSDSECGSDAALSSSDLSEICGRGSNQASTQHEASSSSRYHRMRVRRSTISQRYPLSLRTRARHGMMLGDGSSRKHVSATQIYHAPAPPIILADSSTRPPATEVTDIPELPIPVDPTVPDIPWAENLSYDLAPLVQILACQGSITDLVITSLPPVLGAHPIWKFWLRQIDVMTEQRKEWEDEGGEDRCRCERVAAKGP